MNTVNEDDRTLPLPGMGPLQPTDTVGIAPVELEHAATAPSTGTTGVTRQTLKDAPALDWGELAQPCEAEQNAEIGSTKPARKPRTVKAATAKPAMLKISAAKVNRIDSHSVHTKRSSGTKADYEPQEVKVDAKKAKRTSSRKRVNAVAAEAVPLAPAATVPVITHEAIAFLANENARATDLAELSQESQSFVQYHFKRMHLLEESSRVTNAFLISSARPVSPAFQQFVDALKIVDKKTTSARTVATMSQAAEIEAQATAKQIAVSFAPKPQRAGAHVHVSIILRHFDIDSGVPDAKVSSTEAENSIEPSAPLLRSESAADTDHQSPGIDQTFVSSGGTPDPLSRPTLRKRALQSLGTWLSKRGTQGFAPETAPPPSIGSITPEARDVSAVATNGTSNVVPDEVARRFLKIDQRYYFHDKTHAFIDRGNKLSTHGIHPEVVRSLVQIARARGWNDITVKGSEDFRRSAWMEGASQGLNVYGYQPTTLDLAALANRPAKNSVEKTQANRTAAPSVASVKKVRTEPTAAMSACDPGVPADLALKASLFESEKAHFVVKKFPDLAGAYGLVEAARAFATENLPESARNEFVGMARRHVIQKITTGQLVSGPKIFLAPSTAKTNIGQAKADVAVDLGKSPRANARVTER
jgi:hypothetical protein